MGNIYLVGNAHIDPVWLWRWQDGYSEVLATFRSALDRMKEYDDFKFTSACAVYYQWVEKTDPEMFEEITGRVKEGRWNIAGGWFLQPDCNIPSGESFARHTLISQRYFKEKFGITAKSGYNVDSFGHNASLPMILNGGGMKNYVYMRPDKREREQSFDTFIWKSKDGSEVTAYRLQGYAHVGSAVSTMLEFREAEKNDGKSRMVFYGVGNHGGGPTVKLIEALKENISYKERFGCVDDFFESLTDNDFPVVESELQHHARGCYSATSYVKTMNRKCEENILAAERFCLMANKLTGYEYPEKALRKAWKNLLFNQFHDILCGCAIESAYSDASYLFGEIMSITEQAVNSALHAICRRIDTGASSVSSVKEPARWYVWEHDELGTPMVVFNPHAFPVRRYVTVSGGAAYVTDENNNEVPFQKIRGEQTNGTDRYALSFIAEVPAYGYRMYRAFQKGEGKERFKSLEAEEKAIENELVRVEFSEDTGDISRLIDKKCGRVIFEGELCAVLTDETPCDTWAHNQFDLGDVCGRFGSPEFSVIEKGSVV